MEVHKVHVGRSWKSDEYIDSRYRSCMGGVGLRDFWATPLGAPLRREDILGDGRLGPGLLGASVIIIDTLQVEAGIKKYSITELEAGFMQ